MIRLIRRQCIPDDSFIAFLLFTHKRLCEIIDAQAKLGTVAPELHEFVNTLSGIINRITGLRHV